MVTDMISKLIVTMIQATIDLRLLVGYRLVTLDSWTKLNLQLSENSTALKQIDKLQRQIDKLHTDSVYWQNRCTKLNKCISELSLEKDRLEKNLYDTAAENDRLVKNLYDTSSKLTDAINEVEIANSEMLILRDESEEATELSQQLKEALDRWTS